MKFSEQMKVAAKKFKRTIVLPEGEDQRVVAAKEILEQEGICKVILIDKSQDLAQNKEFPDFVQTLYQMRKDKGLTMEASEQLMQNPLYYSAMLVKKGLADGAVAGAANSTADVLRPALQIIKTAPNISVVSGAFFMVFDRPSESNNLMIFSDCAVNPNPNAQQLAEIGVASAKTAEKIAGLEPKVAFLSFSTKGSAQHELVDKVVSACALAQKLAPQYAFDGELQADTAIVPAIASKKAPSSKIAGQCNVLIFPDLQAGNIAYKLVQRLANAEAIGPILQGMAKPVNDLSRGCSVDDIVNLVSITVLQAG